MRRAPRIAIAIRHLDGRRGGAELATRSLAVFLVERGCDVHIVSRSVGPEERRLPVTHHRLPAVRGRLARAIAASDTVARLGADVSHDMGVAIDCDIFQSHVGSPLACLEAMEAARPAALRLVRRFVPTAFHRVEAARLVAAQFGGRSKAFIAVSHRVATDLEIRHGVPRERIRVIHNGVDTERFHPARHSRAGDDLRRRLGVDPDEVLFVAVAHNEQLKGVPVLVDAVGRLARDGLPVRLLICGGSSPAAAPVGRSRIQRLGLVADPAACYAAADVAVQPTYHDACSLVTLEAIASGLPVVTTRANGAAELITSGVDGIVLDRPGDAAALAAALRPLVTDRWRRASLGRAARTLAERHTLRSTHEAVIRVYSETLAASGIDPAFLDASPPSLRRTA